MIEIAKLFLKEKETGIINEVTLFEDATIDVKKLERTKIVKRFLKYIYHVCFRTDTIEEKKMNEEIHKSVIFAYSHWNFVREREGLPKLNYEKMIKDKYLKMANSKKRKKKRIKREKPDLSYIN